MKTVVLLLSARTALAWICVLAGSTPLANLVMIDFGKLRSCHIPPLISTAYPGPVPVMKREICVLTSIETPSL